MTDPLAPDESLGYRHLRTIAGLLGMAGACVLFVSIQHTRTAEALALLTRGCAAVEPLPSSWLQLTYSLAIPFGMPLCLLIFGVMLFSPTVFGQVVTAVRSLLPWAKP